MEIKAAELRTIVGRNKMLQEARSLMILAFYQEMSDGQLASSVKEKAFDIAIEIVDHYISLYSAPERKYHTAQHALIQTLPLSVKQKLAVLSKCPKELKDWRQAEGLLQKLKLRKRLPNGPKWDLTRLPIQAGSMQEFWQFLRDQMRHDCLYYLPKYKDAEGNLSLQTELLERFKHVNSNLTLEKIVSQDTISNTFRVTRNGKTLELKPDEKISLDDDSPTIGELAAICIFPDKAGWYKKQRNFYHVGKGLNEWASAVYAIQMENQLRKSHHFPPLNEKEVLQTCVLLAATVPFQKKDYLNKIAQNLYLFLHQQESEALCKHLGIQGRGKGLEKTASHLINQMVVRAAKFSGQDVRNFRSGGKSLYEGDRAMACESNGIKNEQDNPLNQFFIAWRSFSDGATLEELKYVDKDAKGHGFIRKQGEEGHIWHYFEPLFPREIGRNRRLNIRQSKVESRHNRYTKNAEIVTKWHFYDMAIQLTNIAEQVGEPVETPRPKIQKYTKNQAQLNQIAEYAQSVFRSEFWQRYGDILRDGGITDMYNFRVAKKVIDVTVEKSTVGSNAIHSLLKDSRVNASTVHAVKKSLSPEIQEALGKKLDTLIQQKEQNAKAAARG